MKALMLSLGWDIVVAEEQSLGEIVLEWIFNMVDTGPHLLGNEIFGLDFYEKWKRVTETYTDS